MWWDSYFSLILYSIWTVSSTLVGFTIIFWNRLSRAPSFSILVRYSSRVVAPIHCISPLASAGFNMFEASKDPVAPPAPTIVWISSINKMISSFFSNSFIKAFIRSSNCPLYFVPATKLARSRDTILLSKRIRDTFRLTTLIANPSAIADLPTPGSPISMGLFFFLLLKIWETRSISLCRPTTGSNFPVSAKKVRSLPKLSSTGVLVFLFAFPFWDWSYGFDFSEANSPSSEEGVSAIGLDGKMSWLVSVWSSL